MKRLCIVLVLSICLYSILFAISDNQILLGFSAGIIALVLTQVTGDSLWFWLVTFSRRIILIEIPKIFLLTFVKPYFTTTQRRWLRKKMNEMVTFCMRPVDKIGRALGNTFIKYATIVSSLFLTVMLFWTMYHFFGQFVIVFLGMWELIKGYSTLLLNTIRSWTVAIISQKNLDRLAWFGMLFVPTGLYLWCKARHDNFIKKQISWRNRKIQNQVLGNCNSVMYRYIWYSDITDSTSLQNPQTD